MAKTIRLYSLFKRTPDANGKRHYERIRPNAYPKPQAVRVWQTPLIESAFTPTPYELRPVGREYFGGGPTECPVCKMFPDAQRVENVAAPQLGE